MKAFERRSAPRYNLRIPLIFRPIREPPIPEQTTESVNLSERGVYFATDFPLCEGTPVQLLLKVPEEIAGKRTTEWRCTGRVIHVEPNSSPQGGKLGVGVRFDHFDVLGADREAS